MLWAAPRRLVLCFNFHGRPPFVKHYLPNFICEILNQNIVLLETYITWGADESIHFVADIGKLFEGNIHDQLEILWLELQPKK